jgi:hypothetical protein
VKPVQPSTSISRSARSTSGSRCSISRASAPLAAAGSVSLGDQRAVLQPGFGSSVASVAQPVSELCLLGGELAQPLADLERPLDRRDELLARDLPPITGQQEARWVFMAAPARHPETAGPQR